MVVLSVLWVVILAVFLISTLVILVGAPYVPTLSSQRKEVLALLELKKGQVLYDLGSGDGSLLKEAAQRGIKAVGYELNPFLCLLSWIRTRRYGGQVSVRWGNFWKADLSNADGIYVFLLDRYMARLDAKISREAKNNKVKVVSHAFAIPGRKPVKKQGPMFLYHY